MSSLNSWQIIGNLGADPETRQVGDTSVCSFSVACTEKWKDKSGQTQERTEWVRVELWGRVGEVAQQYLSKGSQAYVEGSARTDKYQDKATGADRYSTKMVGRKLILLGGGKGGQTPAAAPSQSSGSSGGGFSDDVPFAAMPSFP